MLMVYKFQDYASINQMRGADPRLICRCTRAIQNLVLAFCIALLAGLQFFAAPAFADLSLTFQDDAGNIKLTYNGSISGQTNVVSGGPLASDAVLFNGGIYNNIAGGFTTNVGASFLLSCQPSCPDIFSNVSGGVKLSTTGSGTDFILLPLQDRIYVTSTSQNQTFNGEILFSGSVADLALLTSQYILNTGDRINIKVLRDTATISTSGSSPVNGPFTMNVVFSSPVTGFDSSDIVATNSAITGFSGTGAAYSFVVNPTGQSGSTISVYVPAGSTGDAHGYSNIASNTVSLQVGSPSSIFDDAESAVRSVVAEDAVRTLRSSIGSNQRMTREARVRFLAGIDGLTSTTDDMPEGFSGYAVLNGAVLSTKGSFLSQAGTSNNNWRRVVYSDFDLQHDDGGSSTGTITGRVLWEQSISSDAMIGYFIGADLARSHIASSFNGDQSRLAFSVGGYLVRELGPKIYLDAFLSLGAGRNNLTLSNGVLDLESDYTTRTATLGGTLSGVIEKKGFEIWPEISFSFGRTWLGDVGFSGAAYGSLDNTLLLDAGHITLGNILLRPEVRMPLDGRAGSESLQLFTLAPRVVCERAKAVVTDNTCGAGAEFGFSGNSANGLSSWSARVMADRVEGSTNSSLQLNLQHQF